MARAFCFVHCQHRCGSSTGGAGSLYSSCSSASSMTVSVAVISVAEGSAACVSFADSSAQQGSAACVSVADS